MTYYAINIDLTQTLLTKVEVVVQANSQIEASAKALETFALSLPEGSPVPDGAVLIDEFFDIGTPGEVKLDPDAGETPESIPYVYNLITNKLMEDHSSDIFAPIPDLESDPFTTDSEVENLLTFYLGNPLVPAVEIKQEIISAEPKKLLQKSMSDGTILEPTGGFAARPKVARPITRRPNGYLPLDGVETKPTLVPGYLVSYNEEPVSKAPKAQATTKFDLKDKVQARKTYLESLSIRDQRSAAKASGLRGFSKIPGGKKALVEAILAHEFPHITK